MSNAASSGLDRQLVFVLAVMAEVLDQNDFVHSLSVPSARSPRGSVADHVYDAARAARFVPADDSKRYPYDLGEAAEEFAYWSMGLTESYENDRPWWLPEDWYEQGRLM